PRVELARGADEEQADAVDVLVGTHRAGRLERGEIGQRQAEAREAKRARMQEIAARQTVTEMDGFVGVELDQYASGSASFYAAPGRINKESRAWPERVDGSAVEAGTGRRRPGGTVHHADHRRVDRAVIVRAALPHRHGHARLARVDVPGIPRAVVGDDV